MFDQLRVSEEFAARLTEIYADPESQIHDVIEFLVDQSRARQAHDEGRAAAGCVLDPELATVALHEGSRDREPDARARRVARTFAAHELREHVLALRGRDPRAVILEADDDGPVFGTAGHFHLAGASELALAGEKTDSNAHGQITLRFCGVEALWRRG